MLEILFWIIAAFIFWSVFGYPLTLWLVSRFYRQQIHSQEIEPSVTVIIAAYNEEKAIADKLNNTLAMEAGIRNGKKVFDWLGQGDWCRIHWRPGKHAQNEVDWYALLDFADEYFFRKQTGRKYNQWVFPEYDPALDWSVPK